MDYYDTSENQNLKFQLHESARQGEQTANGKRAQENYDMRIFVIDSQ